MSEQGFKGVPGVPDWWELVAIRNGRVGEWAIDTYGAPYELTSPTVGLCVIIRKIEFPKRYRPFADCGEYVANRRDAIAADWKSGDTAGFYAIGSANDSFVWVVFGKDIKMFSWDQAFEKLVFRHIDGSTSPFGVEVTE